MHSYLVGLNIKCSKTCLKQPLKKKTKIGFKTDYRLMQVKSIAECSNGSLLQYFPPSLSYHLSLRSLFCLFFEWPLKTGFTVVCLNLFNFLPYFMYVSSNGSVKTAIVLV